MRTLFILAGLGSLATFAGGCAVEMVCPESEGQGSALFTERVECPEGPEGNDPGDYHWWHPDQYEDEEGTCRSEGAFHAMGCAPTFELALDEPSRCGPVCAGTCGDWLVVQDTCAPSLGCTYDSVSRALVGVVWGDDTPSNCGDRSYDIIYGDGCHGCGFTDVLDADACSLLE